MKHEFVWGRSESRPGSINLKVFGQRLSPHVQSGTSSEVNDRSSRKKKAYSMSSIMLSRFNARLRVLFHPLLMTKDYLINGAKLGFSP